MNEREESAVSGVGAILVCLANPAHAENLVRRGARLAEMVPGTPMVLLHVRAADPESVEFSDLFHHDVFQRLAEKFGVELIEREAPRAKVAEVICAEIGKCRAGQVVLGQTPGSRLARLFRPPVAAQVSGLRKDVDIHIVSMPEGLYDHLELDSGIRCAAVPEDGGVLRIVLDPESAGGRPGWFFRRSSTEFDHGYYVPWPAAAMEVHRVVDGVVQAVVARRVATPEEPAS